MTSLKPSEILQENAICATFPKIISSELKVPPPQPSHHTKREVGIDDLCLSAHVSVGRGNLSVKCTWISLLGYSDSQEVYLKISALQMK